jgi:hypothetical protein
MGLGKASELILTTLQIRGRRLDIVAAPSLSNQAPSLGTRREPVWGLEVRPLGKSRWKHEESVALEVECVRPSN